jgi:methionine aminopeptidase
VLGIALALNDMYRGWDLLKYRSFGYGHSFGVLSHYYGREAGVELREDVDTVLEPGMVVSMEPMIMIPEGCRAPAAIASMTSSSSPKPARKTSPTSLTGRKR